MVEVGKLYKNRNSGEVEMHLCPIQSSKCWDSDVTAHFLAQDPNLIAKSDLSGVVLIEVVS